MNATLKKVSVPSRGNGVIDISVKFEGVYGYTVGFRPLSGKWGYRLFDMDIEKQIKIAHVVSVPSRGNGVIDQVAYGDEETGIMF